MLKMSLNKIIILVLIFATKFSFAQQVPLGSQYYANMFVINPAMAGNSGNMQAFLSHRSQFAGVPGGPLTSYFSIDGSIKKDKIGLGMVMTTDVTDILTRNSMLISYSYGVKFGEDHSLKFGIGVGIQNNRVDFDKATFKDQGDLIIAESSRSRTGFTSDFGLFYKLKNFELGFAVPNLVSNSELYLNSSGEDFTLSSMRHVRSTLKYNFYLNKSNEVVIYPMMMVRAVKGAPIQWDANLVLDAKKIGWLGISYHSNYALAVSAGVRFKNLTFGYVHDFGIGQLQNFTKGANEFLLGYQFKNSSDEQLQRIIEIEKRIVELEDSQIINKERFDSLSQVTNKNITELEKQLAQTLEKQEILNDSISQANKMITEISLGQESKAKLALDSKTKKKTDGSIDEKVRTESRDLFTDEDGNPIENGYYIVVGTFGVPQNAVKFKNSVIEAGYTNAKFLQRKNPANRNIYVFYTKDLEEAKSVKSTYAVISSKVWILRIE
jgi:type IX secretion system PorP/SprF family membrane protein